MEQTCYTCYYTFLKNDTMHRPFLVIGIAVLVIGGTVLLWRGRPTNTLGMQAQKKAPHFESSTPAHGQTLAGAPTNVVIDFNFDLATKSSISITREDAGEVGFGFGDTTVDENKVSMRQRFSPTLSPEDWDGLYTVRYEACWPDGSCHDGNFQFRIDRSLADSFDDRRGQPEVTVKLSELMFAPKDLRISKGTKVLWVNDENLEHYVNTDSHPAHTYFPAQNSDALKQGDTFEQTFETRGIYPYHCSAHAAVMTGSILVE